MWDTLNFAKILTLLSFRNGSIWFDCHYWKGWILLSRQSPIWVENLNCSIHKNIRNSDWIKLSKVTWAPGCISLNHLTSKKSVEEVVTTLTSPHTQPHWEKARSSVLAENFDSLPSDCVTHIVIVLTSSTLLFGVWWVREMPAGALLSRTACNKVNSYNTTCISVVCCYVQASLQK